MEIILLAIACFLILVVADAIEDYGFITNNSMLWHTADAAYRLVPTALSAYLITGPQIGFFTMWIILLLWYWLLFDLLLNVLKDRSKPLYVGYTAWIDRQFRNLFMHPEWPMLITKISLIGIFTTIYYLL